MGLFWGDVRNQDQSTCPGGSRTEVNSHSFQKCGAQLNVDDLLGFAAEICPSAYLRYQAMLKVNSMHLPFCLMEKRACW